MKDVIATFGNIRVEPYELIHLLSLEIKKPINSHARLTFTALIDKSKKEAYIRQAASESTVKITLLDENSTKSKGTVIFDGIVLNVKVNDVRGTYYLTVDAISHTYALDRKRNKRSFQNPKLTYSSLIKAVLSDYKGADFIDGASHGKAIQTFVMQYEETDWQFLKRMASRFNAVLVASANKGVPSFYFGLPEGQDKGEVKLAYYTMKKRIADYQSAVVNKISGAKEEDYVEYLIESSMLLEPGNEVRFNSRKLVVGEAVSTIRDGILHHTYKLYPRNGLRVKKEYNNAIIGASIHAKVVKVHRDTVRAKLDMDDQEDPNTDYWFPYSTIYASEDNTGWYCMPEQGDNIRIYFPSKKEEEGYAISSVKREVPTPAAANANATAPAQDRMSDPDVKTFRTKYGKEIMLSPDQIKISANGMSITISDANGIEIVSDKNVNINAGQDIVLSASTLNISASQLVLSGGENSITLSDKTIMKGSEIKMN